MSFQFEQTSHFMHLLVRIKITELLKSLFVQCNDWNYAKKKIKRNGKQSEHTKFKLKRKKACRNDRLIDHSDIDANVAIII